MGCIVILQSLVGDLNEAGKLDFKFLMLQAIEGVGEPFLLYVILKPGGTSGSYPSAYLILLTSFGGSSLYNGNFSIVQ